MSDYELARYRLWHRVQDWWREATGPIEWERHHTLAAALWRRFVLWVPLLVLLAFLGGAGTFYLYVGWRARDLAEKAVVNAQAGRWQLARLQIQSARNLRSRDPVVTRSAAHVESILGNPQAHRLWKEVGEVPGLTSEEISGRARAAMLAGTEEEFRQALTPLDSAGRGVETQTLRGERAALRGNLDRAIEGLRAASVENDTPELRLELARLLLQRHLPMWFAPAQPDVDDKVGVVEFMALVDSLQGTPLAMPALELGLRPASRRVVGADKVAAWSARGLADLSPENPALLAAAAASVESGAATAAELHDRMLPVFAGASMEQRAAFAVWLAEQNLPAAALAVITPDDAHRDTTAFLARANALARLQDWEGLRELGQQAGDQVRAPHRFMALAQAGLATGNVGAARKAVTDALQAAARSGDLPTVLQAADALVPAEENDARLVELCGQANVADVAFRQARLRFEREGRQRLFEAAFDRALKAAPEVPAVADYDRYRSLLAARPVDTSVTAAAVEAEPANALFRTTHALSLLQRDRASEAMAVLDDITLFFDTLPAGPRAVVVAVLAGSGRPGEAAALAPKVNINNLLPAEYLLLRRAVPAGSLPD